MAIYKRVKCPKCAKRYTLHQKDEKKRKITCKKCKSVITVDNKTSVYFIEYYVSGKRRREQAGTSKVLAENILAKRKLEIVENKFLDRKEELRINFKDFSKEYFETHSKPNNRSWRTSDLVNINTLNHYFGNKCLSEITSHHVTKFKAERAKTD